MEEEEPPYPSMSMFKNELDERVDEYTKFMFVI
jgi:hypothetical protein